MQPDLAAEEAPRASSPLLPRLVRAIARTLWRVRWLVVALCVALAFKAGIAPAFAWIAGRAVQALREPAATISSVLIAVGPIYILIGFVMMLAEFAEKVASKAVDARLLMELQRCYIERNRHIGGTDTVSNVLYTAEVATRGLEVVYKDFWRIPAQILAVLIWQWSISPDWVPLLLLMVVPALASVWLVGARLQNLSNEILVWQRQLAASANNRRDDHFGEVQGRIFRATVHIAILRWLTERGLDAALWGCLTISALIAIALFPSFLPTTGELAGAATFLVNLALLMKPLSDIGKVYAKWRESYPATRTILLDNAATA